MRALLSAILTLWASSAIAHPAPFSYLDLHVGADGIRGELVLHVVDVAHDLSIDAERLLDPALAAREGRAGRAQVETGYDAAEVSRRVRDAYALIIADGGAVPRER